MPEMIDPKQLIRELTVEELCQTAEAYYANLPDPTHQMAKPFASTLEAPGILYRMGLLLSGLRLGKSMVVLDFGAGTCWFSRFLNQMQCVTISVDVSATALELGKTLFDISPIVGESLNPPRFIPFDGKRMDVADESVDRIVCFDTFHHVPNQEQVLREFFRVLKPGGIVGFSEPGMHHSQTSQSQYEMQNYTVLENDIRLDEIQEIAAEIGFRDLRIKLVTNPDMDLSYDTYRQIIAWRRTPLDRLLSMIQRVFKTGVMKRILGERAAGVFSHRPVGVPLEVLDNVVPSMRNLTVFFFTKGTFIPDSCSHVGLRYKVEQVTGPSQAVVGETMQLKVRVKNVGESKWLSQNIQDIGVVKAGVHLLDLEENLIEHDFARGKLEKDVMPGESVTISIPVVFAEPGEYVLSIDLVAEHIIWFEILGSQPQFWPVSVA